VSPDKRFVSIDLLLCKMLEIWSVDPQENHSNYFHQMSHFKAEIRQLRFRLGLCPRPR